MVIAMKSSMPDFSASIDSDEEDISFFSLRFWRCGAKKTDIQNKPIAVTPSLTQDKIKTVPSSPSPTENTPLIRTVK
jgi:hypothetical protein